MIEILLAIHIVIGFLLAINFASFCLENNTKMTATRLVIGIWSITLFWQIAIPFGIVMNLIDEKDNEPRNQRIEK